MKQYFIALSLIMTITLTSFSSSRLTSFSSSRKKIGVSKKVTPKIYVAGKSVVAGIKKPKTKGCVTVGIRMSRIEDWQDDVEGKLDALSNLVANLEEQRKATDEKRLHIIAGNAAQFHSMGEELAEYRMKHGVYAQNFSDLETVVEKNNTDLDAAFEHLKKHRNKLDELEALAEKQAQQITLLLARLANSEKKEFK